MYRRKIYLVIAMWAALAGSVRAGEVFVQSSRTAGVLEMRSDTTVFGPEIRLRQICQWQDTDARLFEGVGDLVVTRLASGETTIELSDVRELLKNAGVNLAGVRFSGPMSCVVTRADAVADSPDVKPVAPAVLASAAQTPGTTTAQAADDGPVVTLKERLTRDLADRLQLPLDSLQISFAESDEKYLSLSEPQFQFLIEPRRVRNLGTVVWEVTAITNGLPKTGSDAPKAVVVSATARAWENLVVANHPISGRQVIRSQDVVEKRSLVDALPDGPVLRLDQVVGQESAQDVKPGAVMTGHMVQALPLARVGQLVTVTVKSGFVQVRTVAQAMDEGTYGQTIRVRNEGTKEIYNVTLTGPQEGVLGLEGGKNG